MRRKMRALTGSATCLSGLKCLLVGIKFDATGIPNHDSINGYDFER